MSKVKKIFIIIFLILSMILSILLSGCRFSPQNEYTRYTDSFFGTFDTLVQVVAYTKSEEEFRRYFEAVKTCFERLHKLFDIYHNYEGINNLKTINDNAGRNPVKVEQEIIDLILFAKQWYKTTGESANIAFGPVLKIWHDYREEGTYDPLNAALPPIEALRNAAQYTDLDKVIVDEKNSTVFLAEEKMSLDVGAVAKGFAVEIAAQKVISMGMESGVINASGNIRLIGLPRDENRTRWSIGIQNPEVSIFAENERLLDTVYLEEGAIDTSGDYQRYYVVNGNRYHHLIDPRTFFPANYYRSVTVVADNAAVADFLTTALFLLPFEKSLSVAERLEKVEAFWVFPDGSIETTAGMKEILKSQNPDLLQ